MIFGNDAVAKKPRNAKNVIIFNPLCFLKGEEHPLKTNL